MTTTTITPERAAWDEHARLLTEYQALERENGGLGQPLTARMSILDKLIREAEATAMALMDADRWTPARRA